MADRHDAGVGELWTEFVEEAEHTLQTLLVIVNRLLKLVLLTIELMLVVAVNRFADLLDEAGSDTFTGFEIDQLVLDRAGTGIDDKDGFRHCGHPPCIDRCAAYATFQKLDYSSLATKCRGILPLLGFYGGQGDGVDDVLHGGAATEVVHRPVQSLQHRSDGDGAR